jgi:hypothetical protein
VADHLPNLIGKRRAELAIFLLERPGPREHADQLGEEERIAPRDLMELREDTHPRRLRGSDADELGDFVDPETAECHALADARDLAEEAGHPLHLALPVGREQERTRAPQLRSEERQEEDRALVGPVKVVEEDDDGPAFGRPPQQCGQALEEAQARLHRIGRRRRLEGPQTLTDLRYDRREIDRRSAKHAGQRHGVVMLDVSSDRLGPRPVGREPMMLRAPSPENGFVRQVRAHQELLDGARLADTGFADERDEPTTGGAGVIEAAHERVELSLAAHEDAASATAVGVSLHSPADRPESGYHCRRSW